jgi:hypothetical protein
VAALYPEQVREHEPTGEAFGYLVLNRGVKAQKENLEIPPIRGLRPRRTLRGSRPGAAESVATAEIRRMPTPARASETALGAAHRRSARSARSKP